MKKVLLFALTLLCLWNIPLLAQRDPYLRPFANNSIWNMAIHNNAVYVDAKINAPTAWGVTADPEIIILSPSSPNVGIYTSGWPASTRCDKGAFITNAPIPDGWINGIPDGTPNNSTAILAQDGQTVINLQCLHRCATSGPASSLIQYPSENLYGDGIEGGHGGSGMGALGGSIRVGELTPNYTEAQIKADPNIFIKHVIKMNVNTLLYVSNTNGGYRWPAVKADGNYNSTGACDYYGGSVPQFKMGSLLAIPKTVNVETMGLQTGPGIMMARTLQKYGAYLVDATCWDVVAFEIQTGPHGDVESQFATKYGYPFSPQSTSGAWAQDIAKIVQELFVVDSNNASNIGGGPTSDLVNRLAPAICDIGTPGSGIYDCGAVVNVPVTGVTVSPTTASVATGATTTLTATVAPTNATNKNVTWSSSNTAVATVSAAGVVTGVAAGSATITVTTTDGSKTATCAVTVTSSGGTTTGYEAESGTYGGGAQTQTASNASNGAVVGNLNSVGSFTQVSSVNGGSGGTASLVIRYSNGFSSTSAIGLYVNNTFIQNVSFPVTGGWNTFANATVSINLPSGTANTIKLQIGSGNAAADIDKYTVTPNGTTTVSVTGVTVSPTTASVATGAATTLTATVAPSNATNKNVTWTSSNTAVATVGTAGVVTGVAAGTATITVTTTDGAKTATCAVTVTTASATNVALNKTATASGIEGVGFEASKAFDGNTTTRWSSAASVSTAWIYVDLGASYNISRVVLTWEAAYANGYQIQTSNDAATWNNIYSTTTGNGATDDLTGLTGNGRYVRMNATTKGSPYDYSLYEFAVYGTPGTTVAVTGVTVSPTTASIAAGATTTLTATVAPSNATNKNVTWTSSNTAIATVSTAGVVTGVAAGSATITVTTADGAKIATCAVTVTGGGTTTLNIGQTGVMSGQDGGSSTYLNAQIATLSQTATMQSISIYIKAAAGQMYMGVYNNNSGKPGSLVATTAQFTPVVGWNTINVTTPVSLAAGTYWLSYQPNNDGLGQAFSTTSGTTYYAQPRTYGALPGSFPASTLAANTESSVYATLTTGTVSVTGVTMSPTTVSVAVGATSQLTATVAPSNATNKNVTWTSSNTAIATVSTAGVVTGVAVGSATITVTTTDGSKTANSAVTVTTASVGPLKVHLIGNSLTQADPGYRGVLKSKLAADGYNFSFVGTKTDGTSSHSGYGGYIVGPGASSIGNIYDMWTAGTNLNGVACDIIILEIGINDYFNSTDPNYNPESPAAAKLDGLISLIYSTKPNVAIYVSNLTPVAWDANAFGPWNAQVPVIVNKYTSQGKKCYLADVRNGISWNLSTDISGDQLHPSDAGYTKMGNYYAALLESKNSKSTNARVNTTVIPTATENGTLMVYPNPITDNELHLNVSELAGNDDIRVNMFDLTGKVIKSEVFKSGKHDITLQLHDVNSGVYMVLVQSGNKLFRSKIIKK